MSKDACMLISSVGLILTSVFSLTTMATGSWLPYIPTLFFAAITCGFSIRALFNGVDTNAT